MMNLYELHTNPESLYGYEAWAKPLTPKFWQNLRIIRDFFINPHPEIDGRDFDIEFRIEQMWAKLPHHPLIVSTIHDYFAYIQGDVVSFITAEFNRFMDEGDMEHEDRGMRSRGETGWDWDEMPGIYQNR